MLRPMCGCLVAIAAMLSPRLAIFLVWLFGDRMSIAFNSFWIALIGFIFLPWTTLAWAWRTRRAKASPVSGGSSSPSRSSPTS